MNRSKRFRLIFIVYLLLVAFRHVVDAAPVMKIRAEGASPIERAGLQQALENAKARALKKALENQLNTLVFLTVQEREALLQTLLDQRERFLKDLQIVTESSDPKAARMALELQLLTDPFLKMVIDAGYLSRFKQKPRLVIAVGEQHKGVPNPNRPFAALLGEKLTQLKIPVIVVDLPTQPSGSNDAEMAKMVQDNGGDVAVVGQSMTEMLNVSGIGVYQSCRAEIAIRALRSDTGEILSAMQQGVAGLGVSETAAIKKAFSQIPSEAIDTFAKNLLTKWVIGVAEGEIQPSAVAVGTPPQVAIDSPVDQEIINTETARVQGNVHDDKGLRSVQLFVNDTAISLLDATHLTGGQPSHTDSLANGEMKEYSVSRLIPLNQGDNAIRLVALDTDNNQSETTLNVLRLADTPESTSENSTDSAIRMEIDTPKDGETVEGESVTVKGHAKSDDPLADIKVLVNGSEFFTPRQFVVEAVEREAAATDLGNLSIRQTVGLAPGRNQIEVIATTGQGKTAKRQLTVIRREQMKRTDGEKRSQRYAVIIGIGNYQDARIPRLRYTRADAEALYQYLIDPNRGGFPPANVRLLVDEQATLKNLRSTVGTWLAERVNPDDVVLLFYSGHGGLDTDLSGESADGKNRYLITYDADPEDLYATAMSNPELGLMLARIKSQQLIFLLDCCYSGGAASGSGVIKSFTPSNAVVKSDVYAPFAGQGRVVISASRADQVSFELPDLQHGIFTYYLLRGLDGEADLDADGTVTLFELFPYLVKAVEETAQKTVGASQTPSFMGTIVGDLTMATISRKH